MEYRMRYIFKGTRDKAYEIADCHGAYQSYEACQGEEGQELPDYKNMDIEFPDFPETEYRVQFNRVNAPARARVKEDAEHTDLKVFDSTGIDDIEAHNSVFKKAEWVKRVEPQYDYDLEDEDYPLVGTELANFLNFDVDSFMNGGYQLIWKYEQENERDYIIGWKKTEGHDLNKLWVRSAVNAYSVFGNTDSDERIHDSIPFFIRMFGCRFINKDEWKYDLEEVQKIKDLQKRLRAFCNKVFFPKDENDKRKAFERYCQEVKPIERKELRKLIPQDWFTPSSLEQALAIECYAMIRAEAHIFICENCGMYTVSRDKRSSLCSRLYYDGMEYEGDSYPVIEYRYVCKEEKYQRDATAKQKSDIIEALTLREKKRLNHHMNDSLGLPSKSVIRNALFDDFSDIVQKYKGDYQNRVNNAETDDMASQIVNEYVDLIVAGMDAVIPERMKMLNKNYIFRERHSFKRKRNKKV